MPASHGVSAAKIRADLETGRLTVPELNKAVRRVLELVNKAQAAPGKGECSYEEHHALARRIAAESAVLLKNQGGILPLQEGQQIAVLGRFAQEPRYQGAGSSLINPTRLDTVMEQLTEVGVEFSYAPGYQTETDQVDEQLLEAACRLAQKADVAVVFVGLTPQYESEGYDRSHLELPANHTALIQRVAEVNPNVGGVICWGTCVHAWLDQAAAAAYLSWWAGRAGQQWICSWAGRIPR